MTINSTYDFAMRINKYHTSFAERNTSPRETNPNTFDTLMRIRDHFKHDTSVLAVTIPAILDDESFGYATEIILAPIDDDGWMFIEYGADADKYIKENISDQFCEELRNHKMKEAAS